MPTLPYKDSQLSIAERVSDLLRRMTLAEKIAQMYSHWLILSPDGNHRIRNDSFAQAATTNDLKEKLKLGVGQITRPLAPIPSSESRGARSQCPARVPCQGDPARNTGHVTRGMFGRPHGQRGNVPPALNYGSSWNPELMEAVGREIRKEAKQIGCHQGLAPVLDVSRDVRWGRRNDG